MHISTDKMVYKPKDVMFVEVNLVDSITKKPYIIDSEKPLVIDENLRDENKKIMPPEPYYQP